MSNQPVWEKEISNVFTLIEYSSTTKEPRCLIIGGDKSGADQTKTLSLFFQAWGLDRETITAQRDHGRPARADEQAVGFAHDVGGRTGAED